MCVCVCFVCFFLKIKISTILTFGYVKTSKETAVNQRVTAERFYDVNMNTFKKSRKSDNS